MLKRSSLSSDVVANLQLALGIEAIRHFRSRRPGLAEEERDPASTSDEEGGDDDDTEVLNRFSNVVAVAQGKHHLEAHDDDRYRERGDAGILQDLADVVEQPFQAGRSAGVDQRVHDDLLWLSGPRIQRDPPGPPAPYRGTNATFFQARRAEVPADIPASAGALVDRAGLKGEARGDARVSPTHGNFIVNEGKATAADLEALVHHVQATVERVHGVRLVPEVRVIGEAA